MYREEAIALGMDVHDTIHSMKRRSPRHDYHKKGNYMVTLVVEGHVPLLGEMKGNADAPLDSPDAPHVEYSELGDAILRDEIGKISQVFPQVEVWKVCIMPDHIHMLVHVPPTSQLSDVIGHWKSYLATQKGIRFQVNFFDTRIRDTAHYAEKWNYICQNPVARGLVEAPREWKYVIAFDPATGEEREHR